LDMMSQTFKTWQSQIYYLSLELQLLAAYWRIPLQTTYAIEGKRNSKVKDWFLLSPKIRWNYFLFFISIFYVTIKHTQLVKLSNSLFYNLIIWLLPKLLRFECEIRSLKLQLPHFHTHTKKSINGYCGIIHKMALTNTNLIRKQSRSLR